MRAYLVSAVFLCLVLPLTAAAGALQIDRVSADAERIAIEGVWPERCAPRIVSSATRAQVTDVLIGAEAPCAPGATAFKLDLSLEDAFSPVPSAASVRPLRIFAERADGAPILVALRLLGGAGVDAAPETGFWWPREGLASGNALALEVQDDRIFATLLSHDARGNPEWFSGSARLTGSALRIELARVRGSSPFAAATAAPLAQPALELNLAFASPTRARAWLVRPLDESGEIDVVATTLDRRRFAAFPQQHSWLGAWFVAGESDLPRRIEFIASHVDAQGVMRYGTLRDEFRMECNPSDATEPVAEACVLIDAADQIAGRFTKVGLERMDGVDRNGRVLILLRARP